ncbi:MAG: DinB family protein [Acidobacteriota bacterium]|nr:DinB family protein [Acidobacteriota bacterium]
MRTTFAALLLSACAFAQDKPATPAPPPAAPPSFRMVFLNRLQDTETKLVSLAEATPQEKLAWRPAEGVRSAGEVFLHIAGANYFFLTPLGVKPPAGLNMGMEKTVKAQADIVAELKKSFAHVRTAVEGMSDADMSKATKMFGQTLTYEGVLFVMANHMHEHFGQSIAYARTNGIVPPWSKKEN